jgi:hypothetical protein
VVRAARPTQRAAVDIYLMPSHVGIGTPSWETKSAESGAPPRRIYSLCWIWVSEKTEDVHQTIYLILQTSILQTGAVAE